MDQLSKHIADAVLGIDTLWGGDVMCASGTGRFIADSWYSDEPLPAAYTAPSAARLRESGGVGGKTIDREAVDQYLRDVNLPEAVAGVRKEAAKMGGLRGQVSHRPGGLHRDHVGPGDGDSSARVRLFPTRVRVEASTGKAPEPSKPEAKRERVAELLDAPDIRPQTECLPAVDAWRRERVTPMGSVKALGAAVIAYFDNLSAANLMPYLPKDLAKRAARQHRLPAHQGRVVLRLDELPGPRAQCRRLAAIRSQLRDQRLAADQLPGVPAAGEPRSRSRTRDDVCLSAESVRSRKGRLRSHGTDHEHARCNACSKASRTMPS